MVPWLKSCKMNILSSMCVFTVNISSGFVNFNVQEMNFARLKVKFRGSEAPEALLFVA